MMRMRPAKPAQLRSASTRSFGIRAPPLARIRALQERLTERGVSLRLRTPTIVRPEERRSIQKWLDLGLPILSGHLGLVAEFGEGGQGCRGRLRGECFQCAHRGGALSPRRATHRRVGRAHDRRALAARRAVGRRRLRRVPVRPPRGNDDRTLCPFGRVRSRANDVSRSVRAEAHERRADRSDRLHLPGRDRFGLPKSSPAFSTNRRRRVHAARCGARASAAITWPSTFRATT